MKKIKILISSFVILLTICVGIFNVNAESVTLEKIVEKFNESSIVDEYELAGGSIEAINDSDSLTVILNAGGTSENIEFLFEDNILSIEIDQQDNSALSKMYISLNVIDVIGQLHGYEEGDLAITLNSNESSGYTLEEEGFEVEKISETKIKLSVDITKKIPLVDFSNTYIEVSDLENLKELISGDGLAENRKGNVWFNKNGYDGEATLLVAEKHDLTENTYKSILSILEVMFDDEKVIKYFKYKYSNISVGNKNFDGFSIKVNPEDKTQFEENLIPSDSSYEFVRISIDKELAIASANNPEIEEEIENESKSEIQIPYYGIIEGANQKYKIGKTESLIIRIDADYNYFESIYVDNKLVDESNYEIKSGSTVVTLKKEYLDQLTNGEHKIKVTFTDGEYAETSFNVEVPNVGTWVNLNYRILVLIIIISIAGYLLIRKQSKFPKQN